MNSFRKTSVRHDLKMLECFLIAFRFVQLGDFYRWWMLNNAVTFVWD